MEILSQRGPWRLALVAGEALPIEALVLRSQLYRQGESDLELYDALASHLVLFCDELCVGTVRLRCFAAHQIAHESYAARFYGLGALKHLCVVSLEVGRFSLAHDIAHVDALRMIWAGITAYALRCEAGFLFGCSSFQGVDPTRYDLAFALLRERYLGPYPIEKRSGETFAFPQCEDARLGQSQLPPLLRSYLSMGGWVSDHGVIDRELQTLHVFTGLEVSRIPQGRKRLLQRLACE